MTFNLAADDMQVGRTYLWEAMQDAKDVIVGKGQKYN